MNVLEEMNKKKTVTALITVFKDICKKKIKIMTCPATTQKVMANLFTLQY